MTTYTTSRGPCARPGCNHIEAGHLFRADTPKLKDRERGACTHQDHTGHCSCPQYVEDQRTGYERRGFWTEGDLEVWADG